MEEHIVEINQNQFQISVSIVLLCGLPLLTIMLQ